MAGTASDGLAIPASAATAFTVAAVPPLDAPARMVPADGATVDMSSASALDLSWSAVKDAAAYEVALTERKTGRTVFSETVAANKYRYSKLESLDVGKSTLSVAALSYGPDGKAERREPRGPGYLHDPDRATPGLCRPRLPERDLCRGVGCSAPSRRSCSWPPPSRPGPRGHAGEAHRVEGGRRCPRLPRRDARFRRQAGAGPRRPGELRRGRPGSRLLRTAHHGAQRLP
ncbi:MAG: hypothetical protein MZV49_08885 [Rhodopseudomonas palustris]|nr:hypothetical protein [Rhodopseudomonas palustris]